jgi:hypothetical protein
MPINNESKYIKEVWAENLEEEMAILRDRVEQYPFLAMVQGFFKVFYITNNICTYVFICIINRNKFF